jgi:hypothetical protein
METGHGVQPLSLDSSSHAFKRHGIHNYLLEL